jgi:A/G-specific adenine glycosylase
VSALHAKLLDWYELYARELPWRSTADPYAVWVSEIMLQQTRVDTVIPYYERFLERFPTPRALAEADEDSVLSLWSGLGYYRRARMLHAGVREVVAQYGGRVPEEASARRALPGVGRYTAGAIGSIAFGKPEPIVDGNVTRVLARLLRIELPVGTAAMNKRLWQEAERLVPHERPGDFNQALMELGATVCTPRQPKCESCPLSADCEARANGETERLPIPKARKPPIEVELAAVVVTSGRGGERKFWLTKNDEPLFGGLWSVPMTEGEPRDALRKAGLRARLSPSPAGRLEHVLSHRRLKVTLYRATGGTATPTAILRPFTPSKLDQVGISTLTRKLLGHAAPPKT